MLDNISLGSVSLYLLALAVLIIVASSFYTVTQQTVAIIERFGRYVRTEQPGLRMKLPIVEQVARRVSLKVQQLVVEVESKTQDNVFVKLPVAVQYQVTRGRESDSYYQLANHEDQIESYVLDVVRAQVPKMSLDEVFERKDDVGQVVKKELGESMSMYGFTIVNALVRDVDPAEGVKTAMNEIQTQERLKQAALAKGEAAKILVVKQAEAEKETKKLQGEGVAAEREAIAEGIKKSVEAVAATGAIDPAEAMRTLLLTQYFDTLARIGAQSHATTIFLSHSPGGMTDVMNQITTAVISGNQVAKPDTAPPKS
ncbi:MAG TPA: SPFH domain-containing protein [Micropepsaceae bacterium]|jgi:regulator of protease activity HflC (stomatin/prohibitin superfamily)|nr:SPFH domain-containing protein [Micropepsaceae bacterium]